jgi:hypothetical protein
MLAQTFNPVQQVVNKGFKRRRYPPHRVAFRRLAAQAGVSSGVDRARQTLAASPPPGSPNAAPPRRSESASHVSGFTWAGNG